MINAVIIDDEPLARKSLKNLLGRFSDKLIIVGEASNAKSGFELITNTNPDVVFLDVEMPGGNGFDLLKMFNEINFKIIFTTAYGHYAIKAIKYSVLDYIMKPINFNELKGSIEKLDNSLKIDKSQLETLHENTSENKSFKKIIIPNRDSLMVLKLDEIILLKAEANYTRFILKNQSNILSSKTLKEYETLLAEDHFCRVHRSFVVNMNYIKEYSKSKGGSITMTNEETIPISRQRKTEFLEKLNI